MTNLPEGAASRLENYDRYCEEFDAGVEREWAEMLAKLLDETRGGEAIEDMVVGERLNRTIHTAVRLAAKYLNNPRTIRFQDIGQAVVEALTVELEPVIKSNVADSIHGE